MGDRGMSIGGRRYCSASEPSPTVGDAGKRGAGKFPVRLRRAMATGIASVSGLRGVIGDGLDPRDVAGFAAAYASRCEPGPIVVGHDGRASAPTFLAAVLAGVTAAGRDVLLAGPVATPTLGRLVVDRQAVGGVQISASHNPPKYNGLKFFQ